MGDYESAKKWYQEELQKDDFCIDAYYNLGIIYKEEKKYHAAIESYLMAINYNSSDYRYYYNLGCVYVLNGEMEKAFDAFSSSQLINNNVKRYLKNDSEVITFIESDYYERL